MSTPAAFDLDAYLARIGYAGARTPTLDTLHAVTSHHATTIPFENLDVLLGRLIVLTPEAIVAKLVHARRGGYCFEQNNLLLLALRALGFRVTPIGARVRWQQPRDFTPPRTHLFLRVHFSDRDWLTDCGLGAASLTGAIPLEFDRELPTPHEPRRLTNENGRFFHQMKVGDAWTDLCEFTLDEMHPIDCEVANWWTSTSPASKFKQDVAVGIAGPDGTRKAIRGGLFTHRRGAEVLHQRTIDSAADLRALLEDHFRLRFAPETRFGPAGAPWSQ
ncbi:MAG TPA: arylamine N-acetyltransferase [Acidobacteriota bacterium]|nr:arylamine N-acetyltransferase [Acidobacteriota bacterium]